jgi:CubicO group peptidase (beta-lactamase class C family)
MDALSSGKVILPDSFHQMISPAQVSDDSGTTYGYGLYTIQDPYGLQIVTLGVHASFTSFVIYYPHTGLTIVLLSNNGIPNNDILQKIWEKLPILMPLWSEIHYWSVRWSGK